MNRGALIGASLIAALCGGEASSAGPRLSAPRSNAEAWAVLPEPVSGKGGVLPIWARQLAADLPRTTAALLELDLAHRTRSPVAPRLRAAMRWVAARDNRSAYSLSVAALDARNSGLTEERLRALESEDFPGWSEPERAALTFAHKMTVDSASVTDEEFAGLVRHFGERQAASMVLLMAYANFQDRLLHCLGARVEDEGGPLPPLEVEFAPDVYRIPRGATSGPQSVALRPPGAGEDVVADDAEWGTVTFETLQERLERQRQRATRLPIPAWKDLEGNLPAGFMRPSDIIWYRIVFGYAPELAVPFEVYLRTAGAEARPHWDRILGGSLFWITTRAVECPYCMGHCEMNWEVAGLTPAEIEERSRLLAGEDWSRFEPGQQRALAFARKLARTPWEVSDDDIAALQQDFGPVRALLIGLNTSRYHYMTRISNGFQLTLERENVFWNYYNVAQPAAAADAPTGPHVAVLTDAECWRRLPETDYGGDQPLPIWARAVASQLPRTAAAMLELDYAHRVGSPLDPALRAKLRWVVAHANRCGYSEEYALADLRRAGAGEAAVDTLTGDPAGWPAEERDALEFARLLTVNAPSISDELFERLRVAHGERGVAAMVLLAAYGNFQDRVVLGLNLGMEESGPLPPVRVRFAPGALQLAPLVPAQQTPATIVESGLDVVEDDGDWDSISYEELQVRLERQREREPRLPVPAWDEIKEQLPEAMAVRPTRIVWSLTCYGYAHELAVPWSIMTRTLWAECPTDRIVEESLFWIQTRAIGCNYCMGHCEMLLEVAGLDKEEVADRTRRLASADWSSFPPAEQRAYAYARKLSRTPWDLTAEDFRSLEADFGERNAMATFVWLCRGLYMTRISDGFQLQLERENVFSR